MFLNFLHIGLKTERMGFEPMRVNTAVFETAPINHSGTFPIIILTLKHNNDVLSFSEKYIHLVKLSTL